MKTTTSVQSTLIQEECRQYQPRNRSVNCFYAQDCELKTIVSQITKDANNNITENDPQRLRPLSVAELKTELCL